MTRLGLGEHGDRRRPPSRMDRSKQAPSRSALKDPAFCGRQKVPLFGFAFFQRHTIALLLLVINVAVVTTMYKRTDLHQLRLSPALRLLSSPLNHQPWTLRCTIRCLGHTQSPSSMLAQLSKTSTPMPSKPPETSSPHSVWCISTESVAFRPLISRSQPHY